MKRSLFLALLLVGGFACQKPAPSVEDHGKEDEHGHEEGGHAEEVTLTPEGIKAAGIVVQTVQSRSIQAEIRVPGIVQSTPEGRAVVTSPVEGRILRLLATVGDPVRRGQPIAEIESGDLAERATAITDAQRAVKANESEVARNQAEVRLAQGRLRTLEGTLRRQRELARTGAFSQPSLQVAERELNEARSALESAEKEEVVHRAQLERSERLYKQELVSRTELENARLDVEKDRIAQERAAREITIATAAYKREGEIARRGLLNAREVQAAEAETRAARLDVDRATIALRAARDAAAGTRLAVRDAQTAYAAVRGSGNEGAGGRLTLVAPIDGRVVHREATKGQAVERTTELFEIDDLRTVHVVAQVAEGQASALRVGTQVSISLNAASDRRFSGVIASIGGRLDPKTRTLPVICRVDNADGALRPETFAEVTLGRGASRTALVVPKSAVFTQGGKSFVYIEEAPGEYPLREVRTGDAGGDSLAILSGLQAGERVATEGVFTLRSQAQKDELKGHEH
ncbi:efflux RND transporter periplasmic adaptor subunit [bacterium]|nr:MAG: efflux RND transporter periplasmic adaptor subunit [bacterium]